MTLTLHDRLRRCDPSAMGAFAEHLVATAVNGKVVGDWSPYDVTYATGAGEATIQVKCSRTLRTFGERTEPVAGVSFDIRPRHDIMAVIKRDLENAQRAGDVWVFAMHTGVEFDDGWWFFVAPAQALSAATNHRISAARLWSLLGAPVGYAQLKSSLEAARTGALEVHNDWPCPICWRSTGTSGKLAAHLATSRCSQPMRVAILDPSSRF
jgi:hypothetical protein